MSPTCTSASTRAHRRRARALGAALAHRPGRRSRGWLGGGPVHRARPRHRSPWREAAAPRQRRRRRRRSPRAEPRGHGSATSTPQMELQSRPHHRRGDPARCVRTTPARSRQNPPCQIDGRRAGGHRRRRAHRRRAGRDRRPGGASFGIAGGADGRPMWVVVAREPRPPSRPRSPTGRSTPPKRPAASPCWRPTPTTGSRPPELVDDVVERRRACPVGPSRRAARPVTIADGSAGCDGVDPPVGPPVDLTMPRAGRAARRRGRRAGRDHRRCSRSCTTAAASPYAGRPARATRRCGSMPASGSRQEQPDYAAMVPSRCTARSHEIVFTAPDRASVRFRLRRRRPVDPRAG